jgi:hypothetical protein
MDGLFETESERVVTGGDWGDWGLGDLADIVRRTADLLGSGTAVCRMYIDPPQEELGLPRTMLVVPDEDTVAALAARILSEDAPARFCGESFGGGWAAEVDDIELHVAPELEAWR